VRYACLGSQAPRADTLKHGLRLTGAQGRHRKHQWRELTDQ